MPIKTKARLVSTMLWYLYTFLFLILNDICFVYDVLVAGRRDEGGAGETDYGVLMLFQEAFFSRAHLDPLLPALLPYKAHIPSLRAASGVPGGRHSSWKHQPRILPVKGSLGKPSAYPFRTPLNITSMLNCSPSLPDFATSLSL